MRLVLLILAPVLVATGPAAAEQRVAQYGAPYCYNLSDLRSLIAAMLKRDEAAAAGLDCVFLKPGVRADVLRPLAELGPGARIVQVRIYGHGTSSEGYTLSNDLEDAGPNAR